MWINNVDVETLRNSEAILRDDPSRKHRTTRITGTWNLDDSQPQFQSTIKYDNGESTVVADHSVFVGGGGREVAPFQYWIYGFIGCYSATLATEAAAAGVPIRKLEVTGEADLNFSRLFGLGDEPHIEGIRLFVDFEADAEPAEIERLKTISAQRCPALWGLLNPIPVTVDGNRV